MNKKDLTYYIQSFLTTYLSKRRNLSNNTILSYRDSIKLFLNYCINEKNIRINNIDLDVLNKNNVNDFLDYLENTRNCSINSRNQRLASIKSLCKYILEEDISNLDNIQQIVNIKSKKFQTKDINYFTPNEIKSILQQPDYNTDKGLKELVILTLLYDSALRVSELVNLKYDYINLSNPAKVIVKKAKGNKSREIPITKDTANILKKYIEEFKLKDGDALIVTNRREKYTTNGIRYIINKYCKDLSFKATPHTFRHSKASHLVEANIPIIYIRDFLGHEHIETTEIYAKVNNKIKEETIINNSINLNVPIKYDINNSDNELLDFLNNL